MKHRVNPFVVWLGISLLVAGSAFAAAPATIAGRVFHQSAGIPGIRQRWEMSILFEGEGRYRFLKHAVGSVLSADGAVSLQTPPRDGTYIYARTGENTATVTLSEPNGTLYTAGLGVGPAASSLTLVLTFTDDTHGSERHGDVGAEDRPFALFDIAARQTAGVVNLSMRGNVVAGRPLFVGFVIPGNESRDVLIRAAGPALTQFGVSGVSADPDFQVYRGSARIAGAHHGDWSGNAVAAPELRKMFAYTGAFAFAENSKDAAQVIRLSPGAYTVVCSPATSDAGGEVLIEVYTLP